MRKDEVRLLKGLSGKVMWLASCTRPDLAFDALELSMLSASNRAKVESVKRGDKIVKKIKNGQRFGLGF